eukprot:522486_1
MWKTMSELCYQHDDEIDDNDEKKSDNNNTKNEQIKISPKTSQQSPSINLCNELINTFDHEQAKLEWQKLFGKSNNNNDKNTNIKSKKDKAKGKKTIDAKTKDAIYSIFVKVYNKIIPVLATRESDNNKYKPLDIDKQVTEQDISLNETKQIVAKGMKIFRSLNTLLADYGLDEKKNMDECVVSVAFVRLQLKETYNNCVRKDDADNKYWCFDCRRNDPDWLYDMFAPKGDAYVRGGRKGDRFPAESIWNHL